MSTIPTPTPLEPEFASQEEADAYDQWFRAKVQASLDDPRPSVPHDEVMKRMRELLKQKRLANADDPLAP